MSETQRGACAVPSCGCAVAVPGDIIVAGYRMCLAELCGHTIAAHYVKTPAKTPAPSSAPNGK